MILAWGAKVSPEFRARVVRIGAQVRCDPSWLMACMAFETGRTFDPAKKNPNSSATGLIQFMAATAVGLNTTVEALAKMSAVEQLDYVSRYFQPFAGRLDSLSSTYMAILWPAAVGKPDAAIIFKPGSKAYLANRGLDVDHDGAVTKGEAAAFVARYLVEGMRSENAFDLTVEQSAPIEDHSTLYIPPATAQEKPMGALALPFLSSILPSVLQLFSGRAQAQITKATGADPDVSAQFFKSLIDQIGSATGLPVTTEPEAIRAVAAVTAPDAAAKIARLEAQSLEWLDAMAPMLDRISAAEQAKWRAADDSADRASARWKDAKVDIASSLVTQSFLLFWVVVLAVVGLVCWQLYITGGGTIDSGIYALLSVLVYGVVRMADRPSAHRFGGAFEQSETVNTGRAVIDETIRRQTTKG